MKVSFKRRIQTIFFCKIRSFKDSDGDGIGDLNGISLKLEYLKEIGIDGVWIAPIFKVLKRWFYYLDWEIVQIFSLKYGI